MPDAFANVSALPDNMIDVVVNILETRAAIPSQQQMLVDYLSRIDFPEHSEVLEVGCGTGPVCRVLAKWPNVSRVVGIDPSPALLAKARALAQGVGSIEFEEGNGKSLRFVDGAFDVVILHTILTHVPNPQVILAEAFRVLKPGGQLGLCDGDFASMTLQTGPNDPLQACAQELLDNFVTDRWFVRRMSVMTRTEGFQVDPIRTYGLIETSSPGLTMTWVARGADALVADGRIGPELGEALKAEARRRVSNGSFIGYQTYAALTARKPT
jgi:arsenite methyltransferase